MVIIKFFTDHSVDNEYLLITVQDYLKEKHLKREYKEVFIDPRVHDLTKDSEFSIIKKGFNIREFLDKLPENHYLSVDYPGDMAYARNDIDKHYQGILQDRFLDKTWINANLYCNHPQYIVTVQFKHNDYRSFTEWFNRYNELPIKSGILGIGNMCRQLRLNEFVKHALGYAFKMCKHPRIHIYGLAMRCIKYAYRLAEEYNIELSIDSTKWTSAVNQHCRDLANGRGYCTMGNRQGFFDEYLRVLRRRGLKVNGE